MFICKVRGDDSEVFDGTHYSTVPGTTCSVRYGTNASLT